MIILGLYLFAWIGITLLLCLFVQGYLGMNAIKGKSYFKAHKIMWIVIVILGLAHATLAFLFLRGIVAI